MNQNKRIYLGINGIGYGHASRMETLIRFLIKNGFEVYVSTYNEGYNFLKSKFKNVMKLKGLSYYFDEEGRLSFKNTISRNLLSYLIILAYHLSIELRNMIIIRPRLVISDSRASTTLAAFLLRIKNLMITNQSYVEIPRIRPMGKLTRFLKRISERIFFEFWYWICNRADKILIPDLKPPYTISKDTVKIKKKEYHKIKFVGPMIKSNYTFSTKINKQNHKKVVILLSGSIQERLIILRKILSLLDNINNIYFEIFSGIKSIKNKKGNNYELFSYVENEMFIENEINEADVVLMTGGHSSIFKTLYKAKPILFIIPKAHTEKTKNALTLKEMGLAEFIFIDDLTTERLQEYICKLLNEKNYALKARELLKLLQEQEPMNELKKILWEY